MFGKTKINKKEAGVGQFFKKENVSHGTHYTKYQILELIHAHKPDFIRLKLNEIGRKNA